MGNEGFRFFEANVAEAITTGGQLTIQWAGDKLNRLMNGLCGTEGHDYVVYGDTDSISLHVGPFVEKLKSRLDTKTKIVDFIDAFAEKKIQPYFDEIFEELRQKTNAPRQKMKMKREKICDKVIYTAKKRYIANSLDTEGVRHAEPKISVTGIESVRTSVPQICRDALTKAYKIMLNGTEAELLEFVGEFRDEYFTKSFEEIAFPRGANNLDEYADGQSIYKKGTPIHVRGCLLYNHYLKVWGLDKQYESIKSGEKIKFCYLIVPNRIRENVIACPTFLPKEFDLEEYIDYNTMFEKSFFSPLKAIAEVIGCSVEERSSLDVFFR